MAAPLTPYFPRLVIEWAEEAPGAAWQEVEGTLVFMDISGFTAMSERLARKGKVGAEEVTGVMSDTFARLLAAAYARGAYLLKFGGDAMFLLFRGPEHAARAVAAAVDMRRELRQTGRFATSAGRVGLRMSVGVHSGRVIFVLAGDSHRELMVIGDAVTQTARMETAATAGQIAVSDATAALLPPRCAGEAVAGGRLLRSAPPVREERPAPTSIDLFGDAALYIPLAVREQLAAGIDESEHRAVTVAFVHFDGTDELLAERGVAAVAEMLDALVRRVQAAAERFGVAFLATDVDADGGKIILAAGAPTGAENDEERMLRALRALMDDPGPLPLRVGVNRGAIFAGNVGPPYRRTYTVMGDAVNLAARVMAKARPGQVLATADVLDRSATLFETEQLEPFAVKGKARPVTAYSVGRIAGTRTRGDGERLPFVGRRNELRQLEAALDAAARDGARLFEIAGDSGIGKSRLLIELRERHPDVPSHEVACEQYEASTPYFAMRHLLRSLLALDAGASREEQAAALRARVEALAPELLPWLPLIAAVVDVPVASTRETEQLQPAFRQARLHRAVAELMRRAQPGPAIFVVDDAQWIDEASRALLAFLLDQATAAPWVWCATRRIAGSGVNFDEIARRTTMELQPLAPDESSELAAGAAGDVALSRHDLEALAARGGGNPLFLQELVATRLGGTGLSGLPESVEALVVSRIDALDPPRRRALRYASVLGNAFARASLSGSFGDLLGRTGARAAWYGLDEFIVPDGAAGMRFRHALVREVAYEALPFRLRRELHERAGTYFERAAGDEADAQAELLSLHFSLAHDYPKAYRYAKIAGDRSKAKWANVEAAEFFRRAIGAARQVAGVGHGEIASLSEALGDVCELAGQYDDAIDAYHAALGEVRADDAASRRLLLKEGVMRERGGRYAAALRWYGRALQRCGADDVADRVKIEVAYAGVRFRQGRYADCASWCRGALPGAEACGDRASLAHAYYLLAHACNFLGDPEGARYRALALPIYEELGDFVGQANVLNNLGVAAYYYEGDWGQALSYYRRSQAARERAGDVVGAATASNNIGEILSDQGKLDDARALFRSALDVWRAARYPVGIALATSNLGWVAARSGDHGAARELLDEALRGFREIRADSFVFETEARLAEVDLRAGRTAAARSALDDLVLRASRIDDADRVVPALYRLLAETALAADDRAAAATMLEAAIAAARSSGAQFDLMLALRLGADAGLLAAADLDAARAESHAIAARLGVVERGDAVRAG